MENLNRTNSTKGRRDKKIPFLIGAILISAFISIGCFIAYHASGSYVAADGTLVEAFGYIPLSFLFACIALLSTCILGINAIVRRIKAAKL